VTLDFENVAALAMRDYLAGGALDTQLAAIETEIGFGYAIPRPVDYVQAFAPGDNRSPIVKVYAEGAGARGDDAGHRHDLAEARIIVAILYVGGGQPLPAEERLMWQYVQAVRRAVRASGYRLGEGGTRIKFAVWDNTGRDFDIDDKSMTHHARAITFDVGVEDP
jgi:hypothetical protein